MKTTETSSSIGFIKNVLHDNVTPTFTKIRDQFVIYKDQLDVERKLMISHLTTEVTNKRKTWSKNCEKRR